jgi:hypothetical protein
VRGNALDLDVTQAIDRTLAPLRASLPIGYRIETGGAGEISGKAQASVIAQLPLMLVVVLTLLMIQLRSFARVLMVVLTAPLGLIGVVAALLLFGKPFGFVAMLGVIAMSGIIMRNSVILVDQIERNIAAGQGRFDAIVGATVRRFRPIMLTAAAAVLALIPLLQSAFFGPMATALMGGITGATVLTLFFVPALYATAFKVRPSNAVCVPRPRQLNTRGVDRGHRLQPRRPAGERAALHWRAASSAGRGDPLLARGVRGGRDDRAWRMLVRSERRAAGDALSRSLRRRAAARANGRGARCRAALHHRRAARAAMVAAVRIDGVE